MIRLTVSEYETLQEYAEAVVYEFLRDGDTAFNNSAVGWLTVLNYLSKKASWSTRVDMFLEVFNVERAGELADAYDKYVYEISDILVKNNVRAVGTAQTENPIVDIKVKWGWSDEDPLILAERNKGLVARYALLETLDGMFTGLLTRAFVPQFGYDD